MTQIRIDTDYVREVGRRLVAESERVDQIGHELQQAIADLDTWAWDGTSRWRAEPLLGRVRPESGRVAQELEELGAKLARVADAFEEEDNTAAHNLAGMPWVEFVVGVLRGAFGVMFGGDPQGPGDPPPPPPPPPADPGSGEFGQDDPDLGDRLWEQALYRGADAFELLGHSDAARHMRHYLDGSGSPLTVEPGNILRDIPEFRTAVDNELSFFLDDIDTSLRQDYGGEPLTKTFTSDWAGFYAGPGLSQNWFYALGGFSYAFTAVATISPPDTPGASPTVEVTYQMHLHDRYNWDEGKQVDIAGVTITDESLGELHQVGLAQEYDVQGSTDSVTIAIPPDGDQADFDPVDDLWQEDDRSGTRSDPGRERD